MKSRKEPSAMSLRWLQMGPLTDGWVGFKLDLQTWGITLSSCHGNLAAADLMQRRDVTGKPASAGGFSFLSQSKIANVARSSDS